MYAIVDIETTGVRANRDRITEIAIVVHDGKRTLKTFESLVNPEVSIPYNITQITGISNEMVEDAPKFYEIAKQVVKMTEGTIFVAHNVNFDYGFIKEEFARLGFTFRRKKLCTIRLAKVAFPGRRYYNLDAMIRFLKLKVDQRHRAMGDTLATVKLFEAILAKNTEDAMENMINHGVQASKLPPNFTFEKLHALPEAVGVYYFHNKSGEVIYVGKSINIKKRIMEHFANNTQKAQRMQKAVHDITYEITGSELTALLLESHEIKSIKPRYNVAQKPRSRGYCIFSHEDEEGYLRLSVAKQKKTLTVVSEHTNRSDALGTLRMVQKMYELCEKRNTLNAITSPCFNYHLQQCHGACAGEEPAFSYNQRVNEAIERLQEGYFEKDYLLVEQGRSKDELAVILIENGEYKGFGYTDTESGQSINDLKSVIQSYAHNRDVVKIIGGYMKTKKKLKVIELERIQ